MICDNQINVCRLTLADHHIVACSRFVIVAKHITTNHNAPPQRIEIHITLRALANDNLETFQMRISKLWHGRLGILQVTIPI